jgi:hypothetical protein
MQRHWTHGMGGMEAPRCRRIGPLPPLPRNEIDYGMRSIPLALLAASLLAPLARADKFWVGSSDTEKNAVAGSSPNCIEGVLLSEDEKQYQIRVVGGEIVLEKKLVYRVDKDGLTLETIQRAEAAAAEERAKEAPVVPADLGMPPRPVPVDAGFQPSQAPAPEAAPEAAVLFDPVVGRLPVSGRHELMHELRVAWDLTKDRRYMTELRRLRRMR